MGSYSCPLTFGPTGWLDWLRNTRNAMTHRSPATKLIAFTGDLKSSISLARLLYRQPRWSELQSLIFGGTPNTRPFFGAFILRPSEDILDGLTESLSELVGTLTDAMTTCWKARKMNPALIIQHRSQWRTVQPIEPISPFDGYGADISPFLQKADMMASRDGTRWQAARVFDDRRADWTK
ncbi:hypothetical protein [Mycobacterium terramassiliense]|uniref:hypothetical protein n=1 Tax=Mycobacterium terramassiliense TaxID=1841859 RepID=UPI0012FF69DE|nr:hypothetical protein [Mycobacterium terramassiliense]